MSASRLQFDMSFGPAGQRARPRRSGAPLRLLVLADLGGDRRTPLAERKPLALDIDRFDAVFARIAPRVSLDLGGPTLDLSFGSMDDFHPDALWQRLDVFAALRQARDDTRDARQLPRLAAMLGIQAPATAAPAPDAAPAGDAASDIERLLGRAPSAASTTPAEDAMARWVRELVAPHVQPAAPTGQADAVRSALDAAGTAAMRQLLHHEGFQALEAAWRGVERLVRHLELDGPVRLHVFDASDVELQQDLVDHAADLSGSALHRLFNPADGADAEPWGLIVLDQRFGPSADDVQRLATYGALGARAGTPVLASASPALAGASSTAALTQPRDWQPEDDDALAAWKALRGAPMAPWIGLALPRVLLRLPYGRQTDPVSAFAFEEMSAERAHEAYLWGHGSLALALLAGLARQQGDDEWTLADALDLDDLPSHIYTDADGERHQQPVAEQLIGDEVGQAMLARGLMPLLSHRQRNAARLMRWQSVAAPAQALAGLGG